MGIKQLLPFVKKACREGNILELKGCSVAIDVSCLLHKGLFGCMEQFAQGQDTKFYLYYVKKYVQYLLEIGCHVIMVFDGRPLPAKKDTNDERRQRRQENMKAGEVLMSQGKKEEAVAKFQQAVSITQEIVDNTIEFFRKMKNVDVIVSPYESDAQLAFLTKEGLADAVITEDSDLIAFGCDKIVFKWNGDKSDCTIYERRLLPDCFPGEMRTNFDFDKFRRICILSGCDYLQNGLPGIGLQKAQKFFMKTSQTELRKVLPRIPSYLSEKKLKVPEQFIEDFIRAENTFLYQVVFDPRQRCQRPLNAYPLVKKAKETIDDDDEEFVQRPSKKSSEKSEYHYAGCVAAASISMRLALGNSADSGQLNDKFLLPTAIPEWSVWSGQFESGGKKRKRQAAEEREKQKSCGVFVLDSPTKKRKRPAVDDEIFLGDTPEKMDKPQLKSPVAKKSVKRLRNEPDQRESIEELMRIYCPEPAAEVVIDGTEDSSSSKSSSSTENHQLPSVNPFRTAVEASASQSSAISDITVPSDISQFVTPSSTPVLSQQENTIPEPKKSISLPTDVAKTSLGAKLGKSQYFRSKGCSKPFKKPCLSQGDSQPTSASSSPAAEKKPKESLLSAIDDDAESTPSPSRLVNRFSGFKAPGLRRSATK